MPTKNEKTNVMRLLDGAKIDYEAHVFETEDVPSGSAAADIMGKPHDMVFKTLVTVGKSGGHYVFVIPVDSELDLKKAAFAAGEKSVAMVKSKELLPLTGYIHGGCSPIGMKKQFPTSFDETVILFDKIIFSGGRIGHMVEVDPEAIKALVDYSVCDLT